MPDVFAEADSTNDLTICALFVVSRALGHTDTKQKTDNDSGLAMYLASLQPLGFLFDTRDQALRNININNIK